MIYYNYADYIYIYNIYMVIFMYFILKINKQINKQINIYKSTILYCLYIVVCNISFVLSDGVYETHFCIHIYL